jgi:signal transduction histidine kinase
MKNDEITDFNKLVLDNAPVSVITINKDGDITSANKYFGNFSDVGERKNIFKGSFFNREGLIDDYKKLLLDGTIVRREACYEKNSEGQDKYLKILAVPFRDKNGNIEGAISMALDATETVRAKNNLIELNKNLEKIVEDSTKELNKANSRLNEILTAKSTFMADVSHELRNPLAVVQLELEMMGQSASGNDNELKESIEQVLIEVKKMSNMMTDLSILANTDSVSQALKNEEIDFNEFIQTVIKAIQVRADIKKIKIGYKNNSEKISLIADSRMMEKMISNLLRNAIKYNKEDGWINIEAKQTENEIILTVEDSGMGIPAESLPHIFKRFYRAENARAEGKVGSGLGLAICKLVVELHGGEISVESDLGKGTKFTVSLPAKREQN